MTIFTQLLHLMNEWARRYNNAAITAGQRNTEIGPHRKTRYTVVYT